MTEWIWNAAVGLGTLGFAFLVFRVLVRREYASRGHLSLPASILEVLAFAFPLTWISTNLPREWPIVSVSLGMAAAGLLFFLLGAAGVVLSMALLGWHRTMGIRAEGLQTRGMYRFTRNPQVLYFGLLLLGWVLLWPSWVGFAGFFVYAVSGHMMVLTEEEHLQVVYGEEYKRYCSEVPRYFQIFRK